MGWIFRLYREMREILPEPVVSPPFPSLREVLPPEGEEKVVVGFVLLLLTTFFSAAVLNIQSEVIYETL